MALGADIATQRRRLRTGLAAISVAAATLWGATAASAARLTAVKGAQIERYGRIVLNFDGVVSVKARLSGSVLVLTFSEKASTGPERIASEMPDFVSAVRRDPDGTGLRLALQRPYRVNVQQAGETVFVDLLPQDWSGLPPPLPSDVIAELFRRTQAAEAALRAAKPPTEPTPLRLELAHLSTLTRLSLRMPASAPLEFDAVGGATRLVLPGAWRIDDIATRGRLKPAIAALSVENGVAGARLLVTPAAGFEIRTFHDEDGATIDVARKATDPKAMSAAAAGSTPQDVGAADPDAKASARADAKPMDAKPSDAKPADLKPTDTKPERTSAIPSSPMTEALGQHPPEPVQTTIQRPAGPGLVFPFRTRPPAALFERAGIAHLVFETTEPVVVPSGDPLLTPLGPPTRTGRVVLLRFPVPRDRLLDLVPVGPAEAPTGWELVAGENLAASVALSAVRVTDAAGRIGVGIRLPHPGVASWLNLDGERIAVVTGQGPKPAGIPKRQVFVDFELLPSRQGVAVLAQADDLLVRPDLDGVAISRDSGMAVSGVARQDEAPLATLSDLAVDRTPWEASQRGDIREVLNAQMQAIAEVPRAARGPLRMVLARTMLANRLAIEALGVLKTAFADDPVLAGQRDIPMLTVVADALLGRTGDMRTHLAAEILRNDPEARAWQGYLESLEGRWSAANTSFRATASVLDRYPDDLQALLRTAATEAAIETGDWDAANRQIIAATRAADHPTRERLALLRARIDEVTGQTVAALDAYDRLSDSTEAQTAAAARLRATLLGHASGKIPVADAIERLETLSLSWHGGDLEPKTLSGLTKLYIEAGRWRQALMTARRADALGSDSPLVREVHDTAQNLFDDLFLGERSPKLSGVEALALYFDFKDFAPMGRRGDEIVRRLADRLVELDLLDSAGELLQHQVDRRLTGASRAGVATRLAAIRLMDDKPLQALQTLDNTYLPELPEDLRRARALLRARALSDLSRTDLALETIEGETGADAERLRADILWTGRRWREAGEAHEGLVGDAWRRRVPLEDAARTDILRAAIAYGLAGETLDMERLRGKFADAMAESGDARTFALLTQANAVRTPGFREIAQKATSAETLQAFLSEYRKRYPDSAVPTPSKRDTDARADAQASAPPPG
ncbi:hypothetical protein [Methylobacterium sp. Leaf117]|uniref:hypothetical protein n=1 Tax=Methylobacterium sp. Leaf117 TaxID=1736260 RepID=UPI000701D7A0|nr:hypothetical protein [Methylobacterium sp. Leaf117]KQP96666.1 hypothetical protein ASF57_02750 [Methylobacterium sp. Leaf117]